MRHVPALPQITDATSLVLRTVMPYVTKLRRIVHGPRQAVTILCALVALLVLGTGVAWAHDATVKHSEPGDGDTIKQSPTQIVAKFSEEISPTQSSMQVVLAGAPVPGTGPSKLDLSDVDHATLVLPLAKPLTEGTYQVRWHVTLLDGDATDGQFSFTVGQGVSAPKSAQAPVAALVVQDVPATSASNPSPLTQGPLVPVAAGIAAIVAVAAASVTRRGRAQ